MPRIDKLFIATKLPKEEILKMLFEGIGRKVDIHEEIIAGRKPAKYAEIPEFTAFPITLSDNYLLDYLGFSPNIVIHFQPNSDFKENTPRSILIRAVVELIRRIGTDVVLEMSDAEFVALVYRSGELILNSKVNFWTSERIKLIDLPYTLAELPKP